MKMKVQNWHKLGLMTKPKSSKQARLALNAKKFVEGRSCFQEVKRLLLLGTRVRNIRLLIIERNETDSVTAGTLDKYLQLYKRFFLTPLDFLRATSSENDVASAVQRRLVEIVPRQVEINTLEELGQMQLERVKEQRLLEKSLGLPIPDLTGDIQVASDILHELARLKTELGMPGYRRVSQRFVFEHRPTVPLNPTPQEKQEILAFGSALMEMVELTRNGKSWEKEPANKLPTKIN